MKFKTVWAVYFSPVGNTKKIVCHIANGLGNELNIPVKECRFTLPSDRDGIYQFGEDDLVVFGTPVYAGRVPNKILPYVQTGFEGNNTALIPVAVFGNRSVDDGLMELKNELELKGFKAIAGAAIASRHVFSEKIANGRPDDKDYADMDKFVHKIVEKLEQCEELPHQENFIGRNPVGAYYTPLGIDGQPAKFLKAKPLTDMDKCTNCGVCVKVCPLGSISKDNVAEVPGICIKCQACVHLCPEGAKYFNDEAFLSHVKMLEENYTRRAESQFFVD